VPYIHAIAFNSWLSSSSGVLNCNEMSGVTL
jgi:hypothetical protein